MYQFHLQELKHAIDFRNNWLSFFRFLEIYIRLQMRREIYIYLSSKDLNAYTYMTRHYPKHTSTDREIDRKDEGLSDLFS